MICYQPSNRALGTWIITGIGAVMSRLNQPRLQAIERELKFPN